DETPRLQVGGAPEHLNRRIADWMKQQARAILSERVDHYCARLGRRRSVIRIRDTRTRWGSCSSTGVLSFSWRLIMAPPEMLDYVAAHECTHLIHMNHSPAFWRQLSVLGVDCRKAADWFNETGPELFAYGAMAPDNSQPSAASKSAIASRS
ncbi:MAG: M48 family metallopeptidase, partial [Hyphococcus sp.]